MFGREERRWFPRNTRDPWPTLNCWGGTPSKSTRCLETAKCLQTWDIAARQMFPTVKWCARRARSRKEPDSSWRGSLAVSRNYFIVFSRIWELSPRCFSTFFDLACALTNLTILVSPLNQDDWVFNANLLRKWKRREVQRQRALKEKRERFKTRRLQEREEMISYLLEGIW